MDTDRTETADSEIDRAWWKEAVFYQVYPQSFNDSDGDGVGDLPGIVDRVEYLDSLGIDGVWLNPVYESPMADNGYDVADYRAIDPRYGSMDDWKTLLAELHDRDIRLVMDLVLNHTSTEHAWFQRSRANEGEYADYYIWRESDDGYPNNWESMFGGPAWIYDDERGEYYLCLYSDQQPDLNWDNPTVREELYDVVSWWLERDIDGFRMDVINLISKADGLPDGHPNSEQVGSEHFVNGPRLHEYLDDLATEGFGDRADEIAIIGECVDVDPQTAIDLTGRKSNAIDLTIFFEHVEFDQSQGWEPRDWTLPELKSIMADWQAAVDDGAWISLYHSNHDQPRGLSRFGNDEHRYESATMLGTWLHGHRGTPFVYQGEEIGMSNVTVDSPDDLRDVWARNYWESKRASGETFADVRERLQRFGRDNARTPMQWDDSKHAGFTDGDPWIPVAADYETVNVASEEERDRSILDYYRDLIALRDEDDVLVYGDFELLLPDHESLYVIHRTLSDADHELLIVCNFAETTVPFEAPAAVDATDSTVVLANEPDPGTDLDSVDLRPYEAVVYRLH